MKLPNKKPRAGEAAVPDNSTDPAAIASRIQAILEDARKQAAPAVPGYFERLGPQFDSILRGFTDYIRARFEGDPRVYIEYRPLNKWGPYYASASLIRPEFIMYEDYYINASIQYFFSSDHGNQFDVLSVWWRCARSTGEPVGGDLQIHEIDIRSEQAVEQLDACFTMFANYLDSVRDAVVATLYDYPNPNYPNPIDVVCLLAATIT